jgi:hypothetical protein
MNPVCPLPPIFVGFRPINAPDMLGSLLIELGAGNPMPERVLMFLPPMNGNYGLLIFGGIPLP